MDKLDQASRMYDQGYSYRAIAERMELSIESARTAVASGHRACRAEAGPRADQLQDRIDRAILELTIAPPRPAVVLAILRDDHEPIEGVDR